MNRFWELYWRANLNQDFLAGLAKRVLVKLDREGNESNEKNKSVLLQYMFPKGFPNTKLIVLEKWTNRFDFQAFTPEIIINSAIILTKNARIIRLSLRSKTIRKIQWQLIQLQYRLNNRSRSVIFLLESCL